MYGCLAWSSIAVEFGDFFDDFIIAEDEFAAVVVGGLVAAGPAFDGFAVVALRGAEWLAQQVVDLSSGHADGRRLEAVFGIAGCAEGVVW